MPSVRDVGARFIAARLPTDCTLSDVHEVLPRAVVAGPFASSTAVVVRNAA